MIRVYKITHDIPGAGLMGPKTELVAFRLFDDSAAYRVDGSRVVVKRNHHPVFVPKSKLSTATVEAFERVCES